MERWNGRLGMVGFLLTSEIVLTGGGVEFFDGWNFFCQMEEWNFFVGGNFFFKFDFFLKFSQVV